MGAPSHAILIMAKLVLVQVCWGILQVVFPGDALTRLVVCDGRAPVNQPNGSPLLRSIPMQEIVVRREAVVGRHGVLWPRQNIAEEAIV
jgi:hypothetical protein